MRKCLRLLLMCLRAQIGIFVGYAEKELSMKLRRIWKEPGKFIHKGRRLTRILDEHVRWLESAGRQGAKADLKQANLIHVDLMDANLYEADLKYANLRGALLRNADLSFANLQRANLRGADLTMSRLHFTNFSHANLRESALGFADIRSADFTGTKFEGSWMEAASITGCNLSKAIGLSQVLFEGPASIGVDTLLMSGKKVPKSFWREAGVPETLVTYVRSFRTKRIQQHSCFISCSEKDAEFAGRLYSDLKRQGIRCWWFRESAEWGEPVWREIDKSINRYDRVIVVCSENSLQSGPVIREIERTLQREDAEKKGILCPIRTDDYIFNAWVHERKADVISKVVGDFRDWRNRNKYRIAYKKLYAALNKPRVSE